MKLYVQGAPEVRETQGPEKLASQMGKLRIAVSLFGSLPFMWESLCVLCAGGDGSAALLIKDREPDCAEPATAVSFPRAPFSTVAEHPSYRKEHDCYSKQKYSLRHWKLHLQVKHAGFFVK